MLIRETVVDCVRVYRFDDSPYEAGKKYTRVWYLERVDCIYLLRFA